MNMSDELSGAVVGMSSQVAQKGVELAFKAVDKTVDNIAKLLQALFSKKGDKGGKDITSSDIRNMVGNEVDRRTCVAVPVDNSVIGKRIYEVKDGIIEINGKVYPIKLPDGFYIIRKLTVTECCRLQTLPDDYCRVVSA